MKIILNKLDCIPYYIEYIVRLRILNLKLDITKVSPHPIPTFEAFLTFERYYDESTNSIINIKELSNGR